jgi:hypothetical protein
MPDDSFFFWPIVVLIAVIIMVLSARLLLRVALFVVSVLVIWYCLFYVGLLPAPHQFFKEYGLKKVEALTLLQIP